MRVSVLVLTYNEEINIRRCLQSLCGIDDIVVVDSGSTDATVDIATEFGARILMRKFDNFAEQRNYGLECGHFRNEWVLHLDADEELTPEFRKALSSLSAVPNLSGWRVPSKTILNGKWLRHAGMYPSYQVRLTHRDLLRFKQIGHGQREDCPPDRIGTFTEPYNHYNFSHGVSSWFNKHIRYAKDEASQPHDEAQRPIEVERSYFFGNSTERRRSLKRLAGKLPVWLRPVLRFFHVLIVRRGFLDGRAGLQYALMLSAYEAMIAVFSIEAKLKDTSNESVA